MKLIWPVLGGLGGALAVWALLESGDSPKAASASSKPASEAQKLEELLPSFRAKVVELLRRMRADGFRPMIKDAYRSPEKAQEKEDQGLGIALSTHTLRVAVDIIDAKLGWQASTLFWDALHKHSLALGLTRVQRTLANGTKVWDLAHVQGIPVAKQTAMRTAKTDAARETMLRQLYA